MEAHGIILALPFQHLRDIGRGFRRVFGAENVDDPASDNVLCQDAVPVLIGAISEEIPTVPVDEGNQGQNIGHGLLQMPLAFQRDLLGAFTLRDVLHDADPAQQRAVIVIKWRDLVLHVTYFAIQPDDAMLIRIVAARPPFRRQQPFHLFPVVGMDAGEV